MQTGLEKKSLRAKLIVTSLIVTSLAIIISLAISIIDDVRYTRQSTQQQLTILADMMAANSAPALVFRDEQAANDNLQLLHINQLITSARILDQGGNLFANYQRSITPESELSMTNGAILSLARLVIQRPVQLDCCGSRI